VLTYLIAIFIFALYFALVRLRWELDTWALRTGLARGREPTPQPPYDPAEIRDLPKPVRRYFEAALVPGCAFIGGATLAHEGQIRLGPRYDAPFTSTTLVIVRRPGFLRQARVRVPLGLAVHDAYVKGEGSLDEAGSAGTMRLKRLRRREGLPASQLTRYLAEAPWYPTALLPRAGVHWEEDGERSARATLVDGLTTTTLRFTFGEDGLVESVCSEARGREINGRLIPQPWEGRFEKSTTRSGYTVPLEATVSWITPNGAPAPYWTGELVGARYD
jgi:hypothetical protein